MMNGMDAVYEQKKGSFEYFCPATLDPLPHLHKELELICVRQGGAVAVVNGKRYALRSGDLFLVFPYEVHYYLDSEPGDYAVICFSVSVLPELEGVIDRNELESHVFQIRPGSETEQHLRAIREADGPYAAARRCAYVALLMTELLRCSKLTALQKTASMTTRRILEYCSRHYTEDLSLDTIAGSLHLSKYYISHAISKQINMHLGAFINAMRINEACRLLRETDKQVGDIALSVGYETIRSFNRSFKSLMGMTPKQYRQREKCSGQEAG